MPKASLAAAAAVALIATAAQTQPLQAIRPRPPAAVQPQTTPSLRQPSMIDLQMQIQALGQQVQDLSSQLSSVSAQLAAVNAEVVTGKQQLDHDYRQLLMTEYATCTLLYQHHWAPAGAHPTPGNPYIPDDYCSKTKEASAPY